MHKAINAKFKKGDRVVSSDGKYHGVVWDIYGDGTVAVQCEEDSPLTHRRIDQNRLKLANCSTANSVVAKAVANARAANAEHEYEVGDYVKLTKRGDVDVPAGSRGQTWRVTKVRQYRDGAKSYDLKADNKHGLLMVNPRVMIPLNSSAEPTVAKNAAAEDDFRAKAIISGVRRDYNAFRKSMASLTSSTKNEISQYQKYSNHSFEGLLKMKDLSPELKKDVSETICKLRDYMKEVDEASKDILSGFYYISSRGI